MRLSWVLARPRDTELIRTTAGDIVVLAEIDALEAIAAPGPPSASFDARASAWLAATSPGS